MRNNKTHKHDRRDFEDEDGHSHRNRRHVQQNRGKRRPIRNWTKVWEENQGDYDALERMYEN